MGFYVLKTDVLPCKHAVMHWAGAGRCWQHRPRTGPVLACLQGCLTGLLGAGIYGGFTRSGLFQVLAGIKCIYEGKKCPGLSVWEGSRHRLYTQANQVNQDRALAQGVHSIVMFTSWLHVLSGLTLLCTHAAIMQIFDCNLLLNTKLLVLLRM